MKLIASKTFIRDSRRFLKKNPQSAKSVKTTLSLLESDVFQPQLKTHKLKGRLKNCWACSVEYDLRIVFEIVKDENEDAILLQTIGKHDEVY
ncbi:MAG: type II toxin-antitoxin system RelE/ParE family toxin [Pyrinomonadaceae bacterium]